MPIYHALTKPELLKKCLHGKTRNANESFNVMIWNGIPKATHVGINNLSLRVYDVIAYFNYGMKATLDVFKMLNIEPGIYTMQICDNLNKERKRNALYKISDKYKKLVNITYMYDLKFWYLHFFYFSPFIRWFLSWAPSPWTLPPPPPPPIGSDLSEKKYLWGVFEF